MFCKNCGNAMEPQAAVCVKCGVATGNGSNFCPNCGAQTIPGAAVCTTCGVALAQQIPAGEQKSRLLVGLMGIFFGAFGVHNFILGYKGKAIAQLLISLLTCGMGAAVTSIWGLIEGIMVLAGNINTDANGVPLKD